MWHKRKRTVPLYYLLLAVAVMAALWGADRKLAAYDRTNQEAAEFYDALPVVNIPVTRLQEGDL